MKFADGSGYTIVEVMTFLAITGLLFISAATAVGGQQRNVQYSQSVRDFESQIQDVINDVSNGYFPDISRGTCSINVSGQPIFTDSTDDKGTSTECVFVGKSLFFNVAGQTEDIGVGTLVGANTDIGVQASLKLSELKPSLAFDTNNVDLTEYKALRYGLKVTKIAQVSDPNITFDTINFIAGLNESSQSSSKNGTLTTNVYMTTGSVQTAAQDIVYYANRIKTLADSSPVNVSGGLFICVQTTDGRNARIVIGGGNVATSTVSEFDLASGVCS